MLRRNARAAWGLPALLTGIALTLSPTPAAAQERPNEEPSSRDTLMDRTDLGNVAQAAQMAYLAGVRHLKQARELAEKAAAAPEGAKREKQQKRARAAYDRAVEQLIDALRTKPTLKEAYDPLGSAYLETQRPQEALQVYAAGLQVAPEDPICKAGLGEALLETGRVREAASAYEALREEEEQAADRLLQAIKRWVDRHRAEPGETSPDVVEALATLVVQWEQEG